MGQQWGICYTKHVSLTAELSGNKYIRLFLEYLRIDKGASVHTISAYARDLNQFEEIVSPAGSLAAITDSDIQKFLKEMKKREQKASSVSRKISALRQFYKFLIQEEVIAEDPTLFIEAPTQEKKLPKALDSASILKLLETVDQGLAYEGKLSAALKLRDRAMVYLLYATGLRVTELITIRVSQIDIEAGYLRVIGKRNKERVVPFAPIAGEILYEYFHQARPLFLPQSEEAFLGARGEALTRQGFWKTLKKIALAAEIPHGLHPHMLRHTFATDLLKSGMNLRSLQMLLGHSDMQTTQIYTHVAPEKLAEVIKKYHPRGGKSPLKR
jgi:integrase/recombinase XerD